MSVHNGLPYLPAALKSILSQTVSEIEVVVVDDGSTDGTAACLAAWALQDRRVTVLTNDARSGQSAGLNRAVAASQAPWIAVLDADDVALPHRMERQLEFASRHRDLGVAGCLAYYIDPQGRRIGKAHHDLSTPRVFRQYMQKGEAIGLLHSGALIQRSALEKAGGYRSAFEPANDCDLWNRLSETGEILVQQEFLIEYRIHGRSLSAQSFLGMRLKYEWIRACMRGRRQGAREPSWEEFLRDWDRAPLWKRINRRRKSTRSGITGKPASITHAAGPRERRWKCSWQLCCNPATRCRTSWASVYDGPNCGVAGSHGGRIVRAP